MKRTLLALTCLFSLGVAQAEVHAEKCEPIPQSEWKPQAELERKLANQGWKVSRVKITNGCYEVYGRDEKDRKVETFFHPKTFEVVTAPK
jgi:hypothetical protein